MKHIIWIYLLIGLILSPFIHSNNANSHRPARSSAYQWGNTLGNSFYWPSYLFSIEPEVDGENIDTFQKSIIDIIKYRNEKLFTGKKTPEHGFMVVNSIGSCLIAAGFGKKDEIHSLYNNFLTEKIDEKNLNDIRQKVINRFDGLDFSDIIDEGEKCQNEWDLIDLNHAITSKSENNNKTLATTSEKALPPEPTPQPANSPPQVVEKSPAEVFKEAEMESFREYTRQWKEIEADPQSFLNKCITGDIEMLTRLGGYTQKEAATKAKSQCSTQLTELKACMDKPNARADYCFTEVFERGD